MTKKNLIPLIVTLFLVSCGNDQEKVEIFFKSIEAGDVKTVSRFLQEGMNPNIKNKSEQSGQVRMDTRPIIAAVKVNNLEIVKILLAEGADVNAKNSFKETALHYAVKKGNLNMVTFLLDKGAEINMADTSGNTPLTAILNYGKSIFEQNNLAIINRLIEQGADLNVKTEYGDTPLIIAIKKSYEKIELPQLFIRHGADINARNLNGDTPLHIAAANNNLNIVELLIGAGADHKAKNYNDETPLDVTINKLRDISNKNKYQRSRIDDALEPGYKKIAEILLQLNKK